MNSGYESIHFYDETNDYVYYTSTESEDVIGKGVSSIRHLWRVKGCQIKYIEHNKKFDAQKLVQIASGIIN